jgi:hypothetical protein
MKVVYHIATSANNWQLLAISNFYAVSACVLLCGCDRKLIRKVSKHHLVIFNLNPPWNVPIILLHNP